MSLSACGASRSESPGARDNESINISYQKYMASTRSALILWVEAFEPNARILGGKLPVNIYWEGASARGQGRCKTSVLAAAV